MNHLYNVLTGLLISSTSLEIDNVPAGMAVKVSNNTGVWNGVTLDFDPLAVVVRLDKIDFLDLFTDAEMDNILDAEATDKNVRRFLKKLDMTSLVVMTNQSTINGLNYMEAVGLIGAGRAVEILS